MHQYIKVLNVCVCPYVTEAGSLRGGTTVVTNDLCTYYTQYYVLRVRDNKQMHFRSSSWSGHNQRTASWNGYSQGIVAEADEVGEQQLKRTQSGHSSVWPCETSTHQRHYRHKAHQSRNSRSSSQLLHREELQVPDCSCRWKKGCRGSRHHRGASSKWASYL